MGRRPALGKETSTSSGFPERHSSVIAPAGHHCNVRSGHLNATFGGKDMGSMAQTGLLLVPSDALGHTWALPGALGAGQGLPPETGPKKTGHEETTPSDFRKNLRNHGAPQARPRETARHECEREPRLKFSLRLRRAHLSLSKSAVF